MHAFCQKKKLVMIAIYVDALPAAGSLMMFFLGDGLVGDGSKGLSWCNVGTLDVAVGADAEVDGDADADFYLP